MRSRAAQLPELKAYSEPFMNSEITYSLGQIASAYTVFEADQVLSADQLNALAEVHDDQIRLSRQSLMGVGLITGLVASLQGDVLSLSPGLALTTDGDLLRVASPLRYTAFKPYDDTAPAYAPLRARDGSVLPGIFELLTERRDDDAQALSSLASASGAPAEQMLALLLAETSVSDADLCTATDCDNLGKQAQTRLKLLLVPAAMAESLNPRLRTPTAVFEQLAEVPLPRLRALGSIGNAGQLRQQWLAEARALATALEAAFAPAHRLCRSFLGDGLESNPAPRWGNRLRQALASEANTMAGVLSLCGWLKDLATAWNDFREACAESGALLCAPVDAFPKHVLLGAPLRRAAALQSPIRPSLGNVSISLLDVRNDALVDSSEIRLGNSVLDGIEGRISLTSSALGPDPLHDGNRTPFYPAPVVDQSLERLRFCWRRIDTLIRCFDPSPRGLRITPSQSEAQPLEQRAIPHYYFGAQTGVQDYWNQRLSRSGRARCNYGYAPEAYGATGAAALGIAGPLAQQGFFRVEGHVGQDVNTVASSLEKLITDHGLPIKVEALLLGDVASRVRLLPKPRYTALHRLHQILRHDLAHQLEEVQGFASSFRRDVFAAVEARQVDDDELGDGTLRGNVDARSLQVQASVGRSTQKLRAKRVGREDLSAALQESEEATLQATGLKAQVGRVTRTDFHSPIDALAGSRNSLQLAWLEEHLEHQRANAAAHRLYRKFLLAHPGLEHLGGVPAGGTLVLLYQDEDPTDGSAGGVVLADFCLPYRLSEDELDDADEPELSQKPPRFPKLPFKPLVLQPTREKMIGRITDQRFTERLVPSFQAELSRQYVTDFKTVLQDFRAPKATAVDGIRDDLSAVDALAEKMRLEAELRDYHDRYANDSTQAEDIRQRAANTRDKYDRSIAESFTEGVRTLAEVRTASPSSEKLALELGRISGVAALSEGRADISQQLSGLNLSGAHASTLQTLTKRFR